MRIAMWSGPRNLSTAMMYAFGSRPDFAVWDEPFYAAYLANTNDPPPLQDEIGENEESDPRIVAHRCIGPIPENKPNFYMKHMAHHMIETFPLDWSKSCTNIHLIRHPARVIASYSVKRGFPTLDDIGFKQQAAIFDLVGGLIVDSADIRDNPGLALMRICQEVGLRFDEAMLAWPRGGHASDGTWAPHWYGAVHKSAGFAGPEGPMPKLDNDSQNLADAAMPWYHSMYERKLKIN